MNLWKNVDQNKRRSVLLVFSFILIVIALGWLFSVVYDSYAILVFAVVLAITQSLVSYYSGDKIVLAISGAKQIVKQDHPLLWNTVENLSITAGLPMPKIYIINDPAPNAFATGRDPDHASVAVTTGILSVLSRTELQGVIAHELSHIGNYDIRLSTIVAILVGVVALLSDLFLRARWFGLGRRDNREEGGQIGAVLLILSIIAAILAPIIATLIQLAISRRREFLADSSGALLTRFPEGLANALEKISKYNRPVEKVSSATAHLYFANPFGRKNGEGSAISNLFSTHPPIKERIRQLIGNA